VLRRQQALGDVALAASSDEDVIGEDWLKNRDSACKRHSDETVALIIEAARAEFARQGFGSASMGAIAREAGVARQLLYYYFSSREALYEAVIDKTTDILIKDLVRADFGSMHPAEAIQHFFGRIFDLYCGMDGICPKLVDANSSGLRVRSSKVEPAMVIYRSIIDRGIRLSVFRPDLDWRITYAMSLSLITGCFARKVGIKAFTGKDYSEAELQPVWRKHTLEAIIATMVAPTWSIDEGGAASLDAARQEPAPGPQAHLAA
jgi:AcrR family transcriptional regulator